MKKITSAYANKLLKQLSEEKDFWRNKEKHSSVYKASVGEQPVVPDYDYMDVSEKIRTIDEKVCKIKHAVNLANVSAQINVNGEVMSADYILVRMAQLGQRKGILDDMRKRQKKERESERYYRNDNPDYIYANYDIEQVKQDYEDVSDQIMAMQIALDKYNQTFLFEVDI